MGGSDGEARGSRGGEEILKQRQGGRGTAAFDVCPRALGDQRVAAPKLQRRAPAWFSSESQSGSIMLPIP